MEPTTTIWKFELTTTDYQVIEMPAGSRILTIQTQYGKPCLWAQVDTGQPRQNVEIRIYGTGHPIDPLLNLRYLGTYQIGANAVLVFHVFEEL
jgi:hypothetical protein